MLKSLTGIVKQNIWSQRHRGLGRRAHQPKVGEVGSAVDIHNYHVLSQVRLKESGKRGQLYRGATSRPPLGSCLGDVFGLVHSFHGRPPTEVVLEADVCWLRAHIPEAKDDVNHVRRPDAGLRKSILARGNVMDHMPVPHLLFGLPQSRLQVRHYCVKSHGISEYDAS